MPEAVEMTMIRAGLWRPGIVIIWSAVVAMFVTLAIVWPDQATVFLSVLPLGGLVAWIRTRAVRLEITESVVRARQGWYLPGKQVPRSEIRAIHYYPHMISFTGPDRKPIMRTRSEWTLRQMRAVAGELKVPLYDNRTWAGMRTVRTGRLVYSPASHDPVSDETSGR